MQWKILLRGVAAMIVGYAVIVALTSFGFNVLLGGRPLYGGSALLLGAGMLVATISGLAGGYIAGRAGPGAYQRIAHPVFAYDRYHLRSVFFQREDGTVLVRRHGQRDVDVVHIAGRIVKRGDARAALESSD